MILKWDKPKKLRATKAHNDTYVSDSGVAGTYVPNMSEKDKQAWKAKKIGGDDPRVEIRKTVVGTDPSLKKKHGYGTVSAEILVIVRKKSVIMSANSRMVFDWETWDDLREAVHEALISLDD